TTAGRSRRTRIPAELFVVAMDARPRSGSPVRNAIEAARKPSAVCGAIEVKGSTSYSETAPNAYPVSVVKLTSVAATTAAWASLELQVLRLDENSARPRSVKLTKVSGAILPG